MCLVRLVISLISTARNGSRSADCSKVAVEKIDESYDPSRILVAHPMFEHFGLTDAAIAKVCSRGILVLTADVELQLEMQQRGADALNFNHVRSLGWG